MRPLKTKSAVPVFLRPALPAVLGPCCSAGVFQLLFGQKHGRRTVFGGGALRCRSGHGLLPDAATLALDFSRPAIAIPFFQIQALARRPAAIDRAFRPTANGRLIVRASRSTHFIHADRGALPPVKVLSAFRHGCLVHQIPASAHLQHTPILSAPNIRPCLPAGRPLSASHAPRPSIDPPAGRLCRSTRKARRLIRQRTGRCLGHERSEGDRFFSQPEDLRDRSQRTEIHGEVPGQVPPYLSSVTPQPLRTRRSGSYFVHFAFLMACVNCDNGHDGQPLPRPPSTALTAASSSRRAPFMDDGCCLDITGMSSG
jgi:hypothetical protein